MKEFKKGDRVRRVFNPSGEMAVGTEATVRSARQDGYLTFDKGGALFHSSNFALAPTASGPQWSDVEAGDRVTFRVQETGEEITTTATVGDSRRAATLGLRLGLGLPANRWELLSIEKPKPLPPQTPGSVVFKPTPQAGRANNGRGFALLRMQDSGPSPWITDSGNRWGDHSVQTAYGAGFEVIHDAGAE